MRTLRKEKIPRKCSIGGTILIAAFFLIFVTDGFGLLACILRAVPDTGFPVWLAAALEISGMLESVLFLHIGKALVIRGSVRRRGRTTVLVPVLFLLALFLIRAVIDRENLLLFAFYAAFQTACAGICDICPSRGD